ncbi:MAG: radical SAM protein [Mariprofundaceae bacterium]|nr:radical SAM protein [Mariprofundaceae bacterium]
MSGTVRQLSAYNHDRDTAGLTYVYPVVSRRAGGVSVGVNLNTNHACNWHCVYCQVPDLTRGVAPEINLSLLREELHGFLHELLHGGFMAKRVPEDCRRLCDVAISGNGEPTSCGQFEAVVRLIVETMHQAGVPGDVRLRLITNGSYMHKAHVRQGMQHMAEHHGEVWVKLDAVTPGVIRRINGIKLDNARLRRQIELAASLCPTWIQTCMFAWDGQPPDKAEIVAYLDFLAGLVRDGVAVKGVLLYGLARPSLQPEAGHVSALPEAWMKALAQRIEIAGMPVQLSL